MLSGRSALHNRPRIAARNHCPKERFPDVYARMQPDFGVCGALPTVPRSGIASAAQRIISPRRAGTREEIGGSNNPEGEVAEEGVCYHKQRKRQGLGNRIPWAGSSGAEQRRGPLP
jgi:hypothetical protein